MRISRNQSLKNVIKLEANAHTIAQANAGKAVNLKNKPMSDSRTIKSIAVKGLRLDNYLKTYWADGKQKQEAIDKFVAVWGNSMASHFLSKYDDAESLIWALDSKNLNLFIEKF